jgi:proteasome accessory factor A
VDTTRSNVLCGVEHECLTALVHGDEGRSGGDARSDFLRLLAGQAPSLPGRSGLFNGYGRVYADVNGHIELASAECACPYDLPPLVERQQALAARALDALRRRGLGLVLANNNHDGLLRDGAATWGAHENYLVGCAPARLADLLLPFLVSRVYAGAGGVWAPTGEFLSGVRVSFLRADTGGATTDRRAIFSTAREEHLQGPRPAGFRCHLILGDGHRSHFSLALQVGATALVLAAVQAGGAVAPLPRLPGADQRALWLMAARHFNRLAPPGEPPRAHPLALAVQRHYLGAARRWAESARGVPPWVERLLDDWAQTLARLERDDRAWLAARLDPWIKYAAYEAWLMERGCRWEQLPRWPELLAELALLDQNYHEFANPDNLFDRLERAGLLSHRTGSVVPPGGEKEPFIPETGTRAVARARFIRDHSDNENLAVDWAAVYDHQLNRHRPLTDPFARDYSPWVPGPPHPGR